MIIPYRSAQKMNFWITLCVIFGITNALDQSFIDDFMDKLQEIGGKCAKETHASSADIVELIARQFPPNTHEGKCMIFCIQRGLHTMKTDGSIDRAGALKTLNALQKADPELHQHILRIFVTCGMRVKPVADPCETASLLATCGKTEAEAAGVDAFLF